MMLQRVLARLERAAAPGGVQMSRTLKLALLNANVAQEVVLALESAMLNSGVNATAQIYANAMDEALEQYQIEGVKHQTLYLLINLGRWSGDQARNCKKILKKWTSK